MADQDEPPRERMGWEPLGAARDGGTPAPAVICPFCHASGAEPMAMFGAQLLTDQYYCPACHTPFEHLREQSETR